MDGNFSDKHVDVTEMSLETNVSQLLRYFWP